MQTTSVPSAAFHRFLAPPVGVDGNGRAGVAPLGLRRVESALLRYTSLDPSEVVCTTPEHLPRLLGPWVKVVGFSSSDPLGRGMSNTTTVCFTGGELYSKLLTRDTLTLLKRAKETYGFTVIAGGAGSWQFKALEGTQEDLGIDLLFEGYFESDGPALIEEILSGKERRGRYVEPGTCVERIVPIAHPSVMGVVELSRGCGKGCSFCTMARKAMAHVPEDVVLADVERNVASGISAVVSGSEDFFRYGGRGTGVNPARLCALAERLNTVEGLRFLQIDHANVSSVAQFSTQELTTLHRLLSCRGATRFLWVNLGVESASGELVARNSPGKIAPFRPDDWQDLVRSVVLRLVEAGYFPVVSIVLGLPGEEQEDVLQTLRFVKRLSEKPLVVFPVFYEPVVLDRPDLRQRFDMHRLTPSHFELFRTCYELNFKWVPRLYWDNQRAGGVGLLRRCAVQLLGRLEVASWRRAFRSLGRRLSLQRGGLAELPAAGAESQEDTGARSPEPPSVSQES